MACRRSIVTGVVLLVFFSAAVGAEDLSKDQRQWWIDHYGLIDAKTEPLVARAERIFSRVAAAADKKGNRLPKLVVIGGSGDPYAATIRDGSVIVTHEGLKICYRNASLEIGDSRLAFLIGHELSHLANDDFWHGSAFAAVSSYKDDEQVRRILANQLEKSGGSLDFVKTQELQADSYGIIYMTMAGYDPKAIIGPDNTNFFQYWVSQITGKHAYDDALHVSPEARAEFIRTELQPVTDALARFSQGVQLYQNGNYQAAASDFESFIEKYPGREVYNNVGLSHYQLAMNTLSECAGLLPGLKLPLVLDLETTAQRLRQTPMAEGVANIQHKAYQTDLQEAERFFEKNESAGCFQNESYQADLHEAIRFFEDAEKKDALYLPARINLSSALIISRNYAKAISEADEALKIDPNSTEALNNKATAEHFFNKKIKPENPDALAILKSMADPAASDQMKKNIAPSDRIGAGLTADMGNFCMGPSIVWWPGEHAGFQAFYGQGTFNAYAVRGLVRSGKIAGLTPYAGLGYLSVERESDVYGMRTKFTGRGGEIMAGVILPLSLRFSLLAAVDANNIKLEKTVYLHGKNVRAAMNYSPLSVTATLMLYVFE